MAGAVIPPDGSAAGRSAAGGSAGPVEAAVRARLERIEQVDAEVASLVLVDTAGALDTARRLDAADAAGSPRGPLHGVTDRLVLDVAARVATPMVPPALVRRAPRAVGVGPTP